MRYYIVSIILLILVGAIGYAITSGDFRNDRPATSSPGAKPADDNFKNFKM